MAVSPSEIGRASAGSRWLVVAIVAALTGCPPVKVCAVDGDCEPEGVCRSGVCVVRATGGDAGVEDAGAVDAGVDAGRDGGTDAGSVDAGAVDGGDAGGPDAGGCGGCEAGFACHEPTQRCVIGVVGLSFVRPDANDLFGASQPVRLEVRAELDASVALPGTLSVTSTGFGPFSLSAVDATTWALATLTPPTTGSFPLTARLVVGDAGFEATSQLVVDATRPVVTLEVEPAPARSNDGGFSDRDPTVGFAAAHKKDEVLELRVQSSVPVLVSEADFGFPSTALTARATCTSCTGVCRCFDLDLAQLPLEGLRGTLDAGVGPLADGLGNLSAPANASLEVTRWKWRRSLQETTIATDVLFPPALDEQGRVHLAVGYAGGNAGALWQLTPAGEARVDFNFDKPDFAPICAKDVLYAQQVSTQQLFRYSTDGGLSRQTNPVNLCSNEHWTGTSALVADERLFLLGNTGRLAVSIAGSPTCDTWMPSGSFVSQTGLVVATSLAGTAARAFTSKPQTNASLVRVDYFPSATTKFQNERNLNAVAGVTSLVMFDEVVLTSSTVANPSFVAVTAFNADLSGLALARLSRDGGAATYGQVVVAGTRAQPVVIVVDSLGVLHRFPYLPAGGADAGVFLDELAPMPSVDAPGTASPVVGAGGLLYAVSPTTGRLSVIELSTGQVAWTQANAFTPGAVTPALDVTRGPNLVPQCQRPAGLLYVAALADSAVTAIVVDSPGLERVAPWPTQHHDPGNTRNPETPLSPWSCP